MNGFVCPVKEMALILLELNLTKFAAYNLFSQSITDCRRKKKSLSELIAA
jgi:hypothetical protein